MLVYKENDILKGKENIICHQVNVDGVMGGGLAKQIASTYPNVEKIYMIYCTNFEHDYELLKDDYLIVQAKPKQYIANCFTQKPNFDTDYESLEICFEALLRTCKRKNKTIAVPYGYGCGIAHGDWNIVSQIFDKLSNKYNIPIAVYKLPNKEK